MNVSRLISPRWAAMLFASLCALLLPWSALAAGGADEAVYMEPGKLKWQDAPPTVPKGAKIAVLYGDPSKEGPFTFRLKLPAGYKIPPHWHSQAEYLTIMSGALTFGSGDKPDKANEHVMKAGAFHYLPAKAHHYAYAKGETVVQVQGTGPFDINWINEADDPQKGAKK